MFILFFFTCPALLYADSRTVTITWTMSDTTDVQGYRVYFADNSAMTNKVLHSDCSEPIENPTNTFTITCNNIELEDNQTYYFTIAVLMDDQSELSSNPKEKTYTVSLPSQIVAVQNLKIVIPGKNITSINFQPADAPVINGYVVDSGQLFNDNLGYGWLPSSVASGARDRNSDISDNQAYDTLILINETERSYWEYNLANGTYTVTLCMGDAIYPGSTNNIQIEGVHFFENAPIDSTQHWVEKTQQVTVSDGKLTLTFTGTNPYGQICWLTIN